MNLVFANGYMIFAFPAPLANYFTDFMKHLTNLSKYSYDLEEFQDLDTDLQAFLMEFGLDGIELLIGYERTIDFPAETVESVHLPFWVTWLDIWKERPGAIEKYFGNIDDEHIKYMCGGADREQMIKVQAELWQEAARLNAAYMVIHACHMELEHAVTRNYSYSNAEVLHHFADFLNATAKTFASNEPPVKIGIENLWWPGLTFERDTETIDFIERLDFDNWCFVLDTGHLLNTNHDLKNENDSIDFLIKTINAFPAEIKSRIEVLHLSYSCSGSYQKQSILDGLPVDFREWKLGDKFKFARDHATKIDWHHPFSSTQVSKLIELIKPKFVVHEFLGKLPDRKEKLRRQLQLIFD